MSWGEPQQPPYDPNPYGRQPQQPYDPNNSSNPYGRQPQQPPYDPNNSSNPYGQQPQQPPYDPNNSSNPYGQQPQQPPYDPNNSSNPYGQPQQGPGPQQTGWGMPPQPQPFGTGPGYPQQPYDPNNPYAQQGYGQPEFAQYPAQPPKKGNGMLIGIVVGALVVVGGGIIAALLLTGNHNGSTVALTAPASVDGLTKLTGSSADNAVSQMRSSLAGESEEYPDPVLGAYSDEGGKDVTTILVDEAMDKLSSADQKGLTSTGDASSIVDAIMTGAGVDDAESESTDADDGALSCGTKDESGTSVTICVWYDVKTFGTLQYLDGTGPDDAAPVADEIRAAAER